MELFLGLVQDKSIGAIILHNEDDGVYIPCWQLRDLCDLR
jgi:hypothetical protein